MSDVKITFTDNGSIKVEGDVELVDADGTPVTPPRTDRFFLCRCGRSATKPFCDGSHKDPVFDGTLTKGV